MAPAKAHDQKIFLLVAIQSCHVRGLFSVGFLKDVVAFLERLKSNDDFNCKICLEGSLVQQVLMREVEIELNVKLQCVSKFSGDTLGAGEGCGGGSKSWSEMCLG